MTFETTEKNRKTKIVTTITTIFLSNNIFLIPTPMHVDTNVM